LLFTACCSTVLRAAADIAVKREEEKMQLTVNPSIKGNRKACNLLISGILISISEGLMIY
jgi:hypothetical protein